MRIAIISELYLGGVHGVARTLFALLEHLSAQGHQVLFFAPKGGLESYHGIPVEAYRGIPLAIYPELQVAIPRRDIKDKLRAFGPDLVHLIHPIWFGAWGLDYANELGLPTIASFHSYMDAYAEYYTITRPLKQLIWEYTKYVFNQADLVLCPSQTALDELTRKGMRNVHIWGRGVSTELFSPQHRNANLRRELLGEDKEFVLLYVGRLAKEKNVQFLRQLAQSTDGARLVIVGDGPDRKRLESLFAGTGTVFTGYLTGDALSKIYASSDVFVFPSKTETYGQVVCEAMASGLPVVAFDSRAPGDLITQGENGILCNQEGDFVTKVVQLLHDPKTRSDLTAGAIQSAPKRSWDMAMAQLDEYYQITVSSRKSPLLLRQASPGAPNLVDSESDCLSIPRFLQIDGQQIHYRRAGSGLSILLLHGAAGSWNAWGQTISDLKDQRTVFALDLIGSGDSSKPPANCTIENQADMIFEFTAKLGLAPVILVGHSLGAAIALKAADKYPDLVRHLVLIGGAFEHGRVNSWMVKGFVLSFPFIFRLAHFEPLFDRIARIGFGRVARSSSEGYIERVKLDIQNSSLPIMRTVALSQLESNPSEMLRRVPKPVTIIYGERDVFRKRSARALANWKVISILGAGHAVMLERPKDLARVLLQCQ